MARVGVPAVCGTEIKQQVLDYQRGKISMIAVAERATQGDSRWPGRGIILAFLVVLSGVPAVGPAAVTEMEQKEFERLSESSDEPVKLQLNGQSLAQVIDRISGPSGISFQLADEVRQWPLRGVIEGGDWSAVVRQLMQGFSFLGIIDDQGGYRRVIVTGFAGDGRDASNAGPDDDLADRELPHETLQESSDLADRPLRLWDPQLSMHAVKFDGEFPSRPVKLIESGFEAMDIGQPLQLDIPQEDFPVYGVVSDMRNALGGRVTVWSGPVDGVHETASFTITRGQKMTYITVATGDSIYEVSIDNSSGDGIVVNEADLTRGKDGNDEVEVQLPSIL